MLMALWGVTNVPKVADAIQTVNTRLSLRYCSAALAEYATQVHASDLASTPFWVHRRFFTQLQSLAHHSFPHLILRSPSISQNTAYEENAFGFLHYPAVLLSQTTQPYRNVKIINLRVLWPRGYYSLVRGHGRFHGSKLCSCFLSSSQRIMASVAYLLLAFQSQSWTSLCR